MKIVVIGGTGLIGSKLVDELRDHGHDAVPASPNSGVNTLTGEGLADVLQGASVVVDVSNSPSFEDRAVLEFFETSTRNLLDAEVEAGVGHHVVLTVVGTDRPPERGYFRAKLAQEKLIAGSAVPYSIVHATQFFEFVSRIAEDATVGDAVRLAPVLIQPIAADDVVSALGRVAVGPPLNGAIEIAGPEQFRFDAFIQRALDAHHDPRPVVPDPHALYFGAEVGERTLVPGDGAQLGATTFQQWLDAVEGWTTMTSGFDQQPDPRVRFLHMELEEHARIAEDIVELDAHTWAIHGSIPVDGEVLMAEFDTQEEAVTVLHELFGPEPLPPAS